MEHLQRERGLAIGVDAFLVGYLQSDVQGDHEFGVQRVSLGREQATRLRSRLKATVPLLRTTTHMRLALTQTTMSRAVRWWMKEIEPYGVGSIKPIRLPEQVVVNGRFVMDLLISFEEVPSVISMERACRFLSKHPEVEAIWKSSSPNSGTLTLSSSRDFKEADLWMWMFNAPSQLDKFAGTIHTIHGVPRNWWRPWCNEG